MKKLLSILLVVIMCFFAFCGCSEKATTKKLEDVKDAVVFVRDAAKKTASAKNLTVDAQSVGSHSNKTKYVSEVHFTRATMQDKSVVCYGWSGSQKENEKQMKRTYSSGDRFESFYQFPFNIIENKNLELFLDKSTKPVDAGDGIRYVSCVMSYADLTSLLKEHIEKPLDLPVEVRFYVNADGYLCEMQYIMPLNEDDLSTAYATSFKYSKFNESKLDGQLIPKEETVDNKFPKSVKSTLTREQLIKSMGIKLTYEDIAKTEGRVACNNLYGVDAVIKKDGSILTEESLQDEVSSWKDVVYIETLKYDCGLIGVKKDGSIVMAGVNETKTFGGADFSQFTNMKSVCCGRFAVYGLKNDGTVVAAGENEAPISSWQNVKKISVGGDSTTIVIALKEDGTVYVDGEYAVSAAAGWTDIVDVSAGRFHVVGLKSDGTVVVAGENPLGDRGELKVDSWKDIVAVYAGNMATSAIKSDGSVVAVGYECSRMNTWTRVTGISMGNMNKLGISLNGMVLGNEDWYWF